MPLPLNLFKAFEKGEPLKIVIVNSGNSAGPAQRKAWLIIDGTIEHVTGTVTSVWKTDKRPSGLPTFSTGWKRTIPLLSSSGYYNLFSTVLDDADQDGAKTANMLLWLPILTEEDIIYISSGDTGVKVRLNILEWTP